VLAPNAATELWDGDVPGVPVRTTLTSRPRTIVVSARLLDADGTVLSRCTSWCARRVLRSRPAYPSSG
jgi:beta-mannosidase